MNSKGQKAVSGTVRKTVRIFKEAAMQEIATYYYDCFSAGHDTPGIKEAMKSITYQQAQKYRPGKYGVHVRTKWAPGMIILNLVSDKALDILAFLSAWCYYNGHIYNSYYDTGSREVILCIKNKEYITVWRDRK